MEEHAKHGGVGLASLRAGMHRNTGSKYLRAGKVPSELSEPRTWRTRKDPFAEDWPGLEERLAKAPELEAKALFEDLCERHPGRYQEGQLRTLQRRVKQWRATSGPSKELFFEQEHRPGEAMQTDFTSANKLEITISGEPFPHLLCHPVLPYSNWEWATVAWSESMAALRRGIQSAAFRLGRVPEYSQTDSSSAATHRLGRSQKEVEAEEEEEKGKRRFNPEYRALMRHLGMKPRTTAIGEKEQNGDVEASHRAFKRRLEQHLLLRGSRDFDSVEEWELWLQEVAEKANRLRTERTAEELAVMRVLDVHRLPEYREEDVRVKQGSTIRVKNNTYSVPSRLKGEKVRVRVYDNRLEVYYGGVHQLTVERLLGEGKHQVDYRHIIWSLARKPGAFERYRYREALFPTLVFRQSYDVLADKLASTRKADIEYVRVLRLAASTMECEVEAALSLLLEQRVVPLADRVKALVVSEQPEIPEVEPLTPDLEMYDSLLGELAEAGR
ncbi:MAG: IS21 family transposase [Acidobacteriota bacterium]|nr:IS21 family transposase [Acidobacteriota bacterium]